MKTPKQQRLQVVCAWCKMVIKDIETEDGTKGVTHGICKCCRDTILKIQEEEDHGIVPTYWWDRDLP
jgi:hypothetical protein